MNKRILISSFGPLGVALAIAACQSQGGGAPASSAAPASSSPTATTTSAATASAPAAIEKAKARLNGKSLSDAEMPDITDALQKAGWSSKGGSGMAMGATKTIAVNASKGAEKAKVTLIKPTGKADDANSGIKMGSAKNQEPDYAKKGATYLEGEVLFAVEIEGKPEEAQKLLEQLVEKP